MRIDAVHLAPDNPGPRSEEHAMSDETRLTDEDRDYLGILLEYAYRGEAAGLRPWHRRHACRYPENREQGCALCDTFTWAELTLGEDVPARETTDWWKRKHRTPLAGI